MTPSSPRRARRSRPGRTRRSGARLAALGLGTAALASVPDVAHAYIEPGVGSVMLQALVGGAAAGVAAARLYWREIGDFWKRLSPGRAAASGKQEERAAPPPRDSEPPRAS